MVLTLHSTAQIDVVFNSEPDKLGEVQEEAQRGFVENFEMGGSHSSSLGQGLVLHDFNVKDCNGRDVDLKIYRGKVLLVVNVASKCGFTNTNYTQMSELYKKYKDKGFEILAFPCNQFLKQEPMESQDVQHFVCEKFKADFPVFKKVCVNGPETAPIYKFLKASKSGFLGSRIKWNFTKFLIDKDGQVLKRYSTTTAPFAIEKDIQRALENK